MVEEDPAVDHRVGGGASGDHRGVREQCAAEYRLSHPLFGDREHWYGPPGEPFLSPAAVSRIDAAMVKYARKLDAMAAKAGYR